MGTVLYTDPPRVISIIQSIIDESSHKHPWVQFITTASTPHVFIIELGKSIKCVNKRIAFPRWINKKHTWMPSVHW